MQVVVYGSSESGKTHQETVIVSEQLSKAEAIREALIKVTRKFDNSWQFYVDWKN